MSFKEGIHCVVCNEAFENSKTWSTHLLSVRHQDKARSECLKWGPTDRRNAVVVYCSTSLAQADKVLEYFSCEENAKITNFIWWPDKENIGILVFESPKKVDHVFRTMGGQKLVLSDCVVEVKNAVTCLDLEWSQLIHKDFTREDDLSLKDETQRSNEPTLMVAAESELDCIEDDKPMELLLDEESTEVTQSNSNLSDDDGGSSDILELDCGVTITSCSFHTSQLIQLFKSIEISRERLEIVSYIRTALGPEYEVNMYRNWYLGFGMSELDSLLVHVYISKPDTSEGFMEADEELVHQKISMDIREGSFLEGYSREGNTSIYSNSTTGISFSVQTDALLIVEVQMCRLIEHFCTFDPRVRAFLGLVYFWAKENHISISPSERFFSRDHSDVPAPASLDWLGILFLCKSGILPSVREVQARPHKPIIVRDDNGESYDVGFDTDAMFVEEWKVSKSSSASYVGQTDKFIHDTFLLMKDFVTFLYRIRNDNWVLNTRDAEVHEMDKFLWDEPGSTWSTKLSNDELFRIRYYNDRKGFHMEESCLTMMHPFVLTWRISLSQEMLRCGPGKLGKVMMETRKCIGYFLTALNSQYGKWKDFGLSEVLVHAERLWRKRKHRMDSKMERCKKKQKLFVDPALEENVSEIDFAPEEEQQIVEDHSHDSYQDQVENMAEVSPETVTADSIFHGKGCIPLDCEVIIPRCSPLTSQFMRIIKSIKMSKKKLHIVDLICKSLEPEYKANLYRNWYLKFGMSELLLHVHIDCPHRPEGFLAVYIENVRSKLETRMKREAIPLGRKGKLNPCEYSNSISGISFSIQTDPLLMAEVQTSRLVEYLCSFDPRVRVLLALVYFWVKENGVRISFQNYTKDLVTWDWLVILFLCKSGVIPTVRDIVDRPHKPIIVTCSDGSTHDVGFDADPGFAEEWRQKGAPLTYEGQLDQELSENFILETLSLMSYFIEFLRKFEGCDWVLNPRDAEIHDYHRFWNDEPGTTWHTKLTEDEMHKIKLFNHKEGLSKEQFHLKLMHPLVLTWRISISQEVIKDKDGTAQILQFTHSRLNDFLMKAGTEKCKGLRGVLVWAGKCLEKRNKKKRRKQVEIKMNDDNDNTKKCVDGSHS